MSVGRVTQQFSADFLIIGAGAAGLSFARELCEVASVIVLEREDTPGYHATGRSAAIFVDSYGDEGHSAAWHSRDPSSVGCTAFLRSTASFLARPRGLLYVARSTSPALSDTDSRVRGFSFSPAMKPGPWCRFCARAPLPTLTGRKAPRTSDVHALLTGLQRDIKRRGGRILRHGPRHGCQMRGGHLDADCRRLDRECAHHHQRRRSMGILEVGFGCSSLGDLPLIPFRRTAATVAPPDGLGCFRVADGRRSRGERVFLSPTPACSCCRPPTRPPVAAHDAYADDLDVAIAVDRVFESLTACPVRRVLAQWAGLRTMAPDRRLVIGFDPDVEGLFWLAGQGGFGIQTALGAAALSRTLIGAGGGAHETLAGLAPLVSPARLKPVSLAAVRRTSA